MDTIVQEKKRVSISSKRQFTIPQKFYTMLGFGNEAECVVRNNELVIRPIKMENSSAFAEQILADLIKQGYEGEELLQEFKKAQANVRPAVENMLTEAHAVARGKAKGKTMNDIFGEE